MKKRIKRKESLSPLKIEADAVVLMNKIQQQLISLEQKIDTLNNRSQENLSKEKHFSKPFDRFHRYSNRKQDNMSRKRNFTNAVCADCNKKCEVPFKPIGNRPVYCEECFSKHKESSSFKEKYDSKSGKGDFVQGRHFDKQRGGENRRSGKKKKSIFRRRKEHI